MNKFLVNFLKNNFNKMFSGYSLTWLLFNNQAKILEVAKNDIVASSFAELPKLQVDDRILFDFVVVKGKVVPKHLRIKDECLLTGMEALLLEHGLNVFNGVVGLGLKIDGWPTSNLCLYEDLKTSREGLGLCDETETVNFTNTIIHSFKGPINTNYLLVLSKYDAGISSIHYT